MPVVESILSIGKVCSGLVAVYGWVKGGQASEKSSEIFKALNDGRAEALKLAGPDKDVFKTALRAAEGALTDAYEASLKNSHSQSFRDDVEIAFASLAEVFDTCVPRGQALAELNLDPRKIGEAIADAAAGKAMVVFKQGEGRKLLVDLVVLAFAKLDRQPKFMEALARVNWQENFERLDGLKSNLDAMPDAVAEKVVAEF